MKIRFVVSLVLFIASAAFLIGAISTFANAQAVPKIALYDGRAFLAAEITLGGDSLPVTTVTSKAFTWTPVLPLKKGAAVPARRIIEAAVKAQMWSVGEHDFTIGARTVKYPVLGMVSFDPTGNDFAVIASTTVITVDLKAGEVLHSDGWLIEAKRTIKAGEAIPTVRVVGKGGGYIMSIEPALQTKNKDDEAKAQPYLTIVNEHNMKTSDRTSAVKAWRLSNESIKKGFPPIIRIP